LVFDVVGGCQLWKNGRVREGGKKASLGGSGEGVGGGKSTDNGVGEGRGMWGDIV